MPRMSGHTAFIWSISTILGFLLIGVGGLILVGADEIFQAPRFRPMARACRLLFPLFLLGLMLLQEFSMLWGMRMGAFEDFTRFDETFGWVDHGITRSRVGSTSGLMFIPLAVIYGTKFLVTGAMTEWFRRSRSAAGALLLSALIFYIVYAAQIWLASMGLVPTWKVPGLRNDPGLRAFLIAVWHGLCWLMIYRCFTKNRIAT